jgi:hypothetical protein
MVDQSLGGHNSHPHIIVSWKFKGKMWKYIENGKSNGAVMVVRSCPCTQLSKHYAMKAYGGVDV